MRLIPVACAMLRVLLSVPPSAVWKFEISIVSIFLSVKAAVGTFAVFVPAIATNKVSAPPLPSIMSPAFKVVPAAAPPFVPIDPKNWSAPSPPVFLASVSAAVVNVNTSESGAAATIASATIAAFLFATASAALVTPEIAAASSASVPPPRPESIV